MIAQPIKGLGSEAIPSCYALANQRLEKQWYPSMQCSQKPPIKETAKAHKGGGRGRDFSAFLA